LLLNTTGQGLPLHAAPIRFASWMGGDRDVRAMFDSFIDNCIFRVIQMLQLPLLKKYYYLHVGKQWNFMFLTWKNLKMNYQ
jgi:phosphoenolpyruvate carboxylase